jgi:hypothetical protein
VTILIRRVLYSSYSAPIVSPLNPSPHILFLNVSISFVTIDKKTGIS